ncbi:MAG: TetR/AcrR family transcriptional regulator [Chloroflexota bacterium]|mgnify:CR=1 FL=1|nr:MAG: TetR/AcrR family transcriptional regulator [Chloroflexota bacterium]
MAGTLRERRRQMLRDEILQAAQALIVEKGYGAMSMDELAAVVGISKPTLYDYFPSKGALVVAAATHEMRQLIDLLEEQPAGQTPLERLTLVLREMLQRHMRMQTMGIGPWPEIFRLLCENEEALAYMERIDRDIVAQVQAGIAVGQIDASLDPAAIVHAFYGLMAAMPKLRLSSIEMSDPQRTADGLVEIFVRGVSAPK